MRLRLQRVTLIDQICATLREALQRGEWPEWLPSERRLCIDLGVGRNSLRTALRRLATEGHLRVVPGHGHRNLSLRPRRAHSAEKAVVLLSPLRLEQLRPQQALWIDELRGMLAEAGCLLRLVQSPRPSRVDPVAGLRRVVERERCACWILVRSPRSCQAWFERHRVPCVVAGSCHEGINLPSVDLDYRAMCRHAATTLLRAGHRRIAYVAQATASAGDLHSEAGFLEGVRSFSAVGAAAVVVRHRTDKASLVQSVRRLMLGPRPPTALFVNQSYDYLTVCSVLAQLGRRVPQEVSLLCRDEDRFLSYLEPEPARYVEDPHLYARKLVRITAALMREWPACPPHIRLIPRLRMGASIGQLAR